MASENFDSVAYIEPAELVSWRSQMGKLNTACEDDLKGFSSNASNLSTAWKGYSADAYGESVDSFLKMANSCHENMRDFDKMLEDVITIMENQ